VLTLVALVPVGLRLFFLFLTVPSTTLAHCWRNLANNYIFVSVRVSRASFTRAIFSEDRDSPGKILAQLRSATSLDDQNGNISAEDQNTKCPSGKSHIDIFHKQNNTASESGTCLCMFWSDLLVFDCIRVPAAVFGLDTCNAQNSNHRYVHTTIGCDP
jgi:hypothetical protein